MPVVNRTPVRPLDLKVGDFVTGIDTKDNFIEGEVFSTYINSWTKKKMVLVKNMETGKCYPGHFLASNFKGFRYG